MTKQITHPLAVLSLGLAAFVASAQGAVLEVDPAHSSVGFDIKHLVVSTVHGSFTNFSGTIDFDEKEMANTKIDFLVKADSINTANAKRDEHLRSADFFDVAKYPEAKFVSKSVKANGKNKFLLQGDLTMHGITKPVKFDLRSLGKVKDPYGVEKQMFQASTSLSRKEFGLTYNAALESGGMVLGDEVKLVIDVEAAPKAAPAKK
jgi:polyisoprenoid-binding protein YceI